MKNSNEYFKFLFAQLFVSHVETLENQDLEYDILFPEVVKHSELFLKSEYNTDSQSEYDCINNYLLNEII